MDKPTLVITGNPAWLADIRPKLADYALEAVTQPDGYMNTLIERHAAMILVDGSQEDWKRYTTTPKTSPATRRIPIILVSDDDEQRASASVIGADLTFTPAELVKQVSKLVADYARVIDPAVQEQLDCECDEPLPPLAIEGVKKFNAGEYYPQHDLFEEQWVNTETPVRDLYRAVLQVGVAYYQIERGNYRGALKMLQRSVQWLAILPDVCQGIDVRQLREDSYRVRAELERLGESRLDEFDHALIRGVRMVTD